MRMFVYDMRMFDEKPYFEEYSEELGIEIGYTTEHPSPDNYHLASGYDAVSVIPARIDAELIDLFVSVGIRMICTRTIGFDHIDLEHARKAGVVVTHITYDTSGVAEYTVMLMLLVLRRMRAVTDRCGRNDFRLEGLMGRTLEGLDVGIVGSGRIGTAVLKDLSGFGCRLHYCNRRQSEEADRYADRMELDELLRGCDVVALTLQHSDETHHIIDRDRLALMKEGAILINTARGPLVDTAALAEALESGHLSGAGIDVIEDEIGLYYNDLSGKDIGKPLIDRIRSMDNVVFTQHIAFYYESAVRDMVRNCLLGAVSMRDGKDIPLRLARSELVLRGCEGLGPAGLFLGSVFQIPRQIAEAPSVGVGGCDPAHNLGIVAGTGFQSGHPQCLVHQIGGPVQEPFRLPQFLDAVHRFVLLSMTYLHGRDDPGSALYPQWRQILFISIEPPSKVRFITDDSSSEHTGQIYPDNPRSSWA